MTEQRATRRRKRPGLLTVAAASAAAFALVLALLVAQMRLGRDPALGAWAVAPARSQPVLGTGQPVPSGVKPLRTGSSTTGGGNPQVSQPLPMRSGAGGAGSAPVQRPLRTRSSATSGAGGGDEHDDGQRGDD